MIFDSPTLVDLEEDGDNLILRHRQDTSRELFGTLLIKEETDRGFTENRMFQQFMRIPTLDYIRLTKQHPELHDPDLMEKWVYSHDDCIQFRIAEPNRQSGHGMQLIIR